ncbi:hypothetical protein JCM8547_008432 [Rhodosporidiobolus lusitaniae]
MTATEQAQVRPGKLSSLAQLTPTSSSSQSTLPSRLRTFHSTFPSLAVDSQRLVETDVPLNDEPRRFFMSSASTPSSPPPVIISRSTFLPFELVEHLFRNKRDSAITTKYLPGTAITNGEAALHSFATALVPAVQCADYAWRSGHSAVSLGTTKDGRRLGRRVILSTSLHSDFEDDQVAELFFSVEEQAVEGRDLFADGMFRVPSVEEKRNDALRAAYDFHLKQHIVFHLLPSKRLPYLSSLTHRPWSVDETISVIRFYISSPSSAMPPFSVLRDRFVRLSSPPYRVLSLELLFATHVHSLVNELSALEALIASPGYRSPGYGYAFTFDPPAIFARRFPSELSTLLVLLALKHLISSHPFSAPTPPFPHMRLFALNTFTPSLLSLLPLLRLTLPPHIAVLPRSSLFPGPHFTLATPAQVPEMQPGVAFVVHNNSDAFGQNIETEEAGGSVDGVLGAWGDAARSLRREREDLLKWVG